MLSKIVKRLRYPGYYIKRAINNMQGPDCIMGRADHRMKLVVNLQANLAMEMCYLCHTPGKAWNLSGPDEVLELLDSDRIFILIKGENDVITIASDQLCTEHDGFDPGICSRLHVIG